MSLALSLTTSQEKCAHLTPLFSAASTLFSRNGALATPLPSTTSALFPLQRRGGAPVCTLIIREKSAKICSLQSSVYSSKFRILQALSFHTLSKTAGGGVGATARLQSITRGFSRCTVHPMPEAPRVFPKMNHNHETKSPHAALSL